MSDRLRDLLSTINKGPDGPVKTSLLGLTRYLDEIDGLLMGVPASYMGAWDGLELLAGKALETPALRLDLGLAEVRIKQLQEQLTACEAALAERDARVLELGKLVRHAVLYSGRMVTRGTAPRWVAVKEVFAVGSTTARQLCRDYQFDPEEEVGAAKRRETLKGAEE